eukprot:CAMPEP_0174856758 /NCGR_PEP_ID=MMETSP1114-20130205/36203_1 /TAXON_ID=312471 /ORGANISM="Neobodo designis, Strain CCAP 1951/1" /LENGTH=222 /DNA_ID=CAMNT_0016091563 /DNA_START=73 /DNA_END=741 /DNA_ORIENTATION=-
MYGPKKTNINVHKDFHMGSGKNRERIEKAERANAEKIAEQAVRKQTLEKERMQEQYDRLRSASSVVGSSGKLARRLPLFLDESGEKAAASGDQPAADTKEQPADTKTGAVSKEEQIAIRKALDDERKARDDPLAAIRAHEAAVAAARARAGMGTAAASSTNAAGAASASDKSGLRKFLGNRSLPNSSEPPQARQTAPTAGPQVPPTAAKPAASGLRRMKFES